MVFYTYSPWLVALSVVIALMATFTGLSLTRGLSVRGVAERQMRIAMASVALGGGIWSMHFVAMLAMRFGVPVWYEVIPTIASALIAILLAGLCLLLMHFGQRTPGAIAVSGGLLGVGIVAMHYVGLSAIEGCLPQVSVQGVVLAGVLAVGMGIAAIAIAYGQRTERNILVATAVFGATVAVVHFTAMAQTTFLASEALDAVSPRLTNEQVAVVVMLSVFLISGGFLLSGASFLNRQMVVAGLPAPLAAPPPPPEPEASRPPPAPEATPRLPYERDGRTHLVPFAAVHAIHAEGHYTTAWLDSGPVFCPWSITEAERRLPPGFMRVHRSWLINLDHVTAYERAKDHGWCLFEPATGVPRVPVARSRIGSVREALGL